MMNEEEINLDLIVEVGILNILLLMLSAISLLVICNHDGKGFGWLFRFLIGMTYRFGSACMESLIRLIVPE